MKPEEPRSNNIEPPVLLECGATPTLFVYSLATPPAVLADAIRQYAATNGPALCLSPHEAFSNERRELEARAQRPIIWLAFYELISQTEMEHCDKEADRLIVERNGNRVGHLQAYFQEIKRVKNELIARNVFAAHRPGTAWLLADAPGIDREVWQRHGCHWLETHATATAHEQRFRTWRRKAANLAKVVRTANILHITTTTSRHVFIGTFDRVQQYLDPACYRSSPPPYRERLLLHLALLASPSTNSTGGPLFRLLLWALRHTIMDSQTRLLSSLHEYRPEMGIVAEHLGIGMDCLQDGYLPGYYPSAYLAYYGHAVRFLSFDSPSAEIFRIHGLAHATWPCFRSFRLPQVSPASHPIRQILFIASGSGDWTALKNRSDEDLAFLTICMAARALPDLRFVFRPHPFWVLPQHQGRNSIRRLIEHVEAEGISNLSISAGAIADSEAYIAHHSLSRRFATTEDEIKQADVVLGDHSQALVEAAMAGKVIASVSAARRTEFFINYTRHGIPILRNGDNVVAFLTAIRHDPKFYERYNRAVDAHNFNLDITERVYAREETGRQQ